MAQLLSGVAYLHDNWVLHRDLKTSNVLVNNRGQLKICDFGLARHYGDPFARTRRVVVTLWYRAPELLLGRRDTAPDRLLVVGVHHGRAPRRDPLFQGKSEIDQIDRVFRLLGTPNEKIWPGLKISRRSRKVNSDAAVQQAPAFRFPEVFEKNRADNHRTARIRPPRHVSSRTIPSDASAPRRGLRHEWFETFPPRRRIEARVHRRVPAGKGGGRDADVRRRAGRKRMKTRGADR